MLIAGYSLSGGIGSVLLLPPMIVPVIKVTGLVIAPLLPRRRAVPPWSWKHVASPGPGDML